MERTKKCRWLHFDVVCLKKQTNYCYVACQERRDLLKKTSFRGGTRMIRPFALPDDDRKILLEKGQFIVINSLSHSGPYTTKSTRIRQVQCPRCGKRFTQSGTFGCFGGNYDNSTCDCGFPWKRDEITVVSKEEKP